MRMFNSHLFSETMEGTTARYSSAEHNGLLGMAEKLVVQYRATKVSGTSPTLTVATEVSNDGIDWLPKTTIVSAQALTAGQVNSGILDTGSAIHAAFVRLKVTLGGTTPAANVDLIVCGRAEEAV